MLESRRATRRALRLLAVMRRRRQLEDHEDWTDSLYKAYLTAIVTALAIFYLSPVFGTGHVSADLLADVTERGAAVLGFLFAVLVLLGLRSGARGGPMAPELPDVTHVLLAPLRRDTALRGVALRQLRGVMFTGGVVGIVAGTIAFRRLPGDAWAWLAVGVGLGALAGLSAWGAALVASATRLGMRAATAIGLVLVAWAGLDVARGWTTSPTAQLGRVGLWPLQWSLWGVLGIALALALPCLGLALIGGVSLEAAQRRAQLVGQLRFAATIQDVRTVMVLHRQLAQERPRLQPWRQVSLSGTRLRGCWRRDWQGIARWPAVRAGRCITLAIVSGAALAGAWNGATFLVLVAGAAFFLAALDASEGLAEETDHPERPLGYPEPWGDLVLRHLVVPTLVLGAVALPALATYAALTRSGPALLVGALALLTAVFAAAVGAAAMVVLGTPTLDAGLTIGFPEFASVVVALRQGFPIALVILAMVPVALGGDRGVGGVDTALLVLPIVVTITLGIATWLRSRKLELG